jgi:hypothetical protein
VEWDLDDPAAALIAGKYARKFARGISVGFKGLDYERRTNLSADHFAYKEGSHGLYFKSWQPREFSGVAIGANANALAGSKGIEGMSGDGLKAYLLDLVAKDADFRSAVRGLVMSAPGQLADGSSSEDGGKGSEQAPSLGAWLSQ